MSDALKCIAVLSSWLALLPLAGWAGTASVVLPASRMMEQDVIPRPVDNAAFVPGPDAQQAPDFAGSLALAASPLQTSPALNKPVIDGRDARVFPGLALRFVTLGRVLVPLERGEMTRETSAGAVPSYWRVIPQFGRVWREPGDGEWSRAAFPVTLVNDTENHAHQGLATFLYKGHEVTAVRVQFVQQTAPYLLSPHCVLWGTVGAAYAPLEPSLVESSLAAARLELEQRLPAKPLSELRARVPKGTLDGFGGPVLPKWRVALGLLYQGTLYYEALPTPYGDYPYPLEMRFGVRSVMKSVATPLSLLHLAEVYGPYVLDLRIGDYVPDLDPKWSRIRFIDAANMATGFGGTGTFKTHPNDINDGYLDADYDGWYTAPSNAAKLQHMREHLKPYPWEPGTVMRYRDQDFYVLGIAIDAFLKRMRGADADAWDTLRKEVLEPIGIHHAPAVRTREADGRDGPAWFNAGYYPTLEDLARIALLYEDLGAHDGKQLLHRGLTQSLLGAKDAIDKQGDAAFPAPRDDAKPAQLYRMGFHFTPYRSRRTKSLHYLPTMSGFGDNEVILFPGHVVALRMAKVAEVPAGEKAATSDIDATPRAVDRLAPF